MAADFVVPSLDDAQELVREYGGEAGLRVELTGLSHLGDAPSVLDWLELVVVDASETNKAWEVAGMEMLRDLTTEVESLRDVDGDLDHLVDHLRTAAGVAPEREEGCLLLDELRRHCNSTVIWAPPAIEKEAREIGLLVQELVRDVRDRFAPELAPEYIGRAEALQQRIADFLAAPVVI